MGCISIYMGHFQIRSQFVSKEQTATWLVGLDMYPHVIIFGWKSETITISRRHFFWKKAHLSHLFVSFVNTPSCFWPVPEATLQTAYHTVKKWDAPLAKIFYAAKKRPEAVR